MHATLRRTKLVLCFMLVEMLLLRLTNATEGRLTEDITNEITTTDLNYLTSTEKEFLSATTTIEASTLKSVTTKSTDQVLSTTNPSISVPSTVSPWTPAESTTDNESFTTIDFDLFGENGVTSPSKSEDEGHGVRNIIFY